MLFADNSMVTRKMVDDVLKYKRLDGVKALLQALAGSIFPHGRQPFRPGLALASSGFPNPVQIIWGQGDRIVPASHAEAPVPGARKLILDDAGHMVRMERAVDVNRAIVTLISQ